MNHKISEYLVPILMVIALFTLVWPISTDHTMVMASQGILLAGFIVLALWVWRETSADEREDHHRLVIGRWAYLVGSGILITGIVAQSIRGTVDPWLAWALMGMVLSKVIGSVYSRIRS